MKLKGCIRRYIVHKIDDYSKKKKLIEQVKQEETATFEKELIREKVRNDMKAKYNKEVKKEKMANLQKLLFGG